MTTLKEIMNFAGNAYCTDASNIESVVNEFVNAPMGAVFECVSSDLKHPFNALTGLHGLDDSLLDELNYIEILCLIDDLDNVMEPWCSPEGTSCNAEEFKRYIISVLKTVLVKASERNIMVRKVLGIGTKSLFEYLESRHRDLAVQEVFRNICQNERRIYDAELAKGRLPGVPVLATEKRVKTLFDLLRDTTEICRSRWRSWEKIKDYEWLILTACSMDQEVLLMGFAEAYRERMNIDDLLNTYWPPPEGEDYKRKDGEKKMTQSSKEKEENDAKNN